MFFRVLKYDFKNHLVGKWWKLLILAAFSALILAVFGYFVDQNKIALQYAGAFEADLKNYTFIDVVIQFFGVYYIHLWLVVHVLMMYMVLYFPFKDLSGYGRMVLVYSRSRKSFWYSKCAVTFLWILAFYAVMWIAILIFSVCTGVQMSMTVTELGIKYFPIISDGNTVERSVYAGRHMWTAEFILPLLTAAAMALLQMFLSLIVRPMYSFMFTVALYLASDVIVTPAPFLLPAYGLIYHNAVFNYNGGSLVSAVGLMLCGAVILISVFGGAVLFKKYEILDK